MTELSLSDFVEKFISCFLKNSFLFSFGDFFFFNILFEFLFGFVVREYLFACSFQGGLF